MFTRRVLPLAVLVRLVVVILVFRGAFMVGEGRVTADLAWNLVSGRGYVLSREMLDPDERSESYGRLHDRVFSFYREVNGFYGVLVPERPTMFLVPGYPLFMAGLFILAGGKSYMAVRLAQLALGLLTVYAGYRVASRFLSGRRLLLAGAVLAVNPFELYYEAIPATQALFSLLFCVSVLLSLRLLERPGWRTSVAAGLAWSAAFYMRPVALPFALLCPVFLLWTGRLSRRALASAATLILTVCCLLAPWVLRNASVSGTPRLMPTQGGVNLWEYHGRIFTDMFESEMEGATLLYSPVREVYGDRLNRADLADFPAFRDEPEWVRDSVLFDRSVRLILANPILYGHLVLLRTVDFFKPI
ncbi:glycosyltransferase family 39 protein, partial [Candidatus Fermentibacterales bacterium]|nr:glycosyltransferase family 39 protein [Candidatus Fermentibacterales bacterium]